MASAEHHGRPSRLSVVIPAKDEVDRIGATVAEVRAALDELGDGGSGEIVVVDDGSTDGTGAAAAAAGARVVTLPVNRGKGAAVRAGVQAATGAVVAYTDADLSYAPAVHLPRLLAAVEGGCDMAVGSRRHPDSETLVAASRLRRVSGRVFNAAVAGLVLGQARDTQCGVKAFSADAAGQLFARATVDGFAFDVELFAMARVLGLRVCEVPVRLVSDDVSTVRVAPAAIRMVGDLWRVRRRLRGGHYLAEPPPGTEVTGSAGGDAEGVGTDR